MLNTPLNKLIYLDIETVPQFESFWGMTPTMQELFLYRFHKPSSEMGLNPEMGKKELERVKFLIDANFLQADPEQEKAIVTARKLEQIYQKKAPLFAEFNKIICISTGELTNADFPHKEPYNLKVQSFAGDNERELLRAFLNHYKDLMLSLTPQKTIAAFHGRAFDFPVIAKRIIYNGIKLPVFFDYFEAKPWEVTRMCDPKDIWKASVFDDQCSLSLLCEVFGVPTPKDDIDGSEVFDIYYVKKDLPRIVKYANKDVAALVRVYLKMKQIDNEVVVVE